MPGIKRPVTGPAVTGPAVTGPAVTGRIEPDPARARRCRL